MDIDDVDSAATLYQDLLLEESRLQNEIDELVRDSEHLDEKMKGLRQRMPDPSNSSIGCGRPAECSHFYWQSGDKCLIQNQKGWDLVEKRVLDRPVPCD